jgi:uncharacterized membrane protein YtjA (UPF0391 family)
MARALHRQSKADDSCEGLERPKSRNLEAQMFSWAVIFFIIAIVAGLFGFVGVAGTATNIAWILFVVGLILAIVFMVMGRRPPPI